MYDLIYIYEFEGDLSREIPKIIDADYIGFWKESRYSFLFFKQPKGSLLEQLPLPVRSELVIRHEDWESGTTLGVLTVGHITLHPPWNPSPEGDGLRICIDPGMAFGSGYHPSTKGCLVLLQKLFTWSAPGTVLDLGTGTGILSIACLKMGSRTAYAVDNNNLSIETARGNRTLNSVAERMHIIMGNAPDLVASSSRTSRGQHALCSDRRDNRTRCLLHEEALRYFRSSRHRRSQDRRAAKGKVDVDRYVRRKLLVQLPL